MLIENFSREIHTRRSLYMHTKDGVWEPDFDMLDWHSHVSDLRPLLHSSLMLEDSEDMPSTLSNIPHDVFSEIARFLDARALTKLTWVTYPNSHLKTVTMTDDSRTRYLKRSSVIYPPAEVFGLIRRTKLLLMNVLHPILCPPCPHFLSRNSGILPQSHIDLCLRSKSHFLVCRTDPSLFFPLISSHTYPMSG